MKLVSLWQSLSERFTREFADALDWEKISRYQAFSEPIIDEFQHKIDFCALIIYK